ILDLIDDTVTVVRDQVMIPVTLKNLVRVIRVTMTDCVILCEPALNSEELRLHNPRRHEDRTGKHNQLLLTVTSKSNTDLLPPTSMSTLKFLKSIDVRRMESGNCHDIGVKLCVRVERQSHKSHTRDSEQKSHYRPDKEPRDSHCVLVLKLPLLNEAVNQGTSHPRCCQSFRSRTEKQMTEIIVWNRRMECIGNSRDSFQSVVVESESDHQADESQDQNYRHRAKLVIHFPAECVHDSLQFPELVFCFPAQCCQPEIMAGSTVNL